MVLAALAVLDLLPMMERVMLLPVSRPMDLAVERAAFLMDFSRGLAVFFWEEEPDEGRLWALPVLAFFCSS